MTEVITVAPSRGAWIVEQRTRNSPQTFLSGATAQAAARQLGDAIARGGQRAEIQILMRDGSLAERFVCPARMSPPAKNSGS